MKPFAPASCVLLVCAALAGCAAHRPPVPPEAEACTPPHRLAWNVDEATRLAGLRQRARAFGECMQAHGFALDEDALDRAVLRYEQTRNADWYGGDPRMAVDIRREELRLSPAYWHRRTAPR